MMTLPTSAIADLQTSLATGDTVLDYGLQTHPDPLEITPQGASPSVSTVIVVVSNGTNDYVTVDTLAFAIPIGANAKNLTGDDQIAAEIPQGWTLSQTGGTFTCTPPPDGKRIGPGGLTFQFSLKVNGEVGTAAITITETTEVGGAPETRRGRLLVAKFPADFSVSDLTATPLTLLPGGATTLSWSGVDLPGVDYTLEYGSNRQSGLPATDAVAVKDLQETTVFYLVVTATVGPSQVQIQRERTVTVNRPAIYYVDGPATRVVVGQNVPLYWATNEATVRCDLRSGGSVIAADVPTNMPHGSAGFAVQPDAAVTQYELRAYGASDDVAATATTTVYASPIGVVGTIPVGQRPFFVSALSQPAGVFVANADSGTISLIDPATRKVTATVPVDRVPTAVAPSPDGTSVWVTSAFNGLSGTKDVVSVIDVASQKVVQTIEVGVLPEGIALAPDGSKAYVCVNNQAQVAVINTASYAIEARIPVGLNPIDLVLSPDGSRLYVANAVSKSVSVIDTASNQVIQTFVVSTNGQYRATRVNLSPDGQHLYVSNSGYVSSLAILGTQPQLGLVKSLSLGAYAVAFNAAGSRAFVATPNGGGSLAVLDTTTFQTVETVPMGGTPSGIAAVATSKNTFYFVLNLSGNSLWVVEEALT